jgi:uncharacterized zinc-type alcohol dehydrogenase-like protein
MYNNDIQFCGVCHSDLHQIKERLGRINISNGSRSRNCGKVVKVELVRSLKLVILLVPGCLVDSAENVKTARKA